VYGLNDAVNFIDTNGQWPTGIHNLIISYAFPWLTEDQRQILKTGSFLADNIAVGGQDPENAYRHAMRAPWQTKAEAAAEYNRFVGGAEQTARNLQIAYIARGQVGFSPEALAEFSLALHAAIDNTSPKHEGFQVWWGMRNLLSLFHAPGEERISAQQLAVAIEAARDAYTQTFGSGYSNSFVWLDMQNNMYTPVVTVRIPALEGPTDLLGFIKQGLKLFF
jgi:hypothetical protein